MKKQCFITRTNERTGKVYLRYIIYETKKSAQRFAKERTEEEKEYRTKFPERFEGELAEDTYKYEVHELEKDRELYENLKQELDKKIKIKKLFMEAFLEALVTPRKVITGETTHGTKWEIRYFPKSFKGKIHYHITYTISDGTQFGADEDLIPEELESWVENHDPAIVGRQYWAYFK